MLSERDRAEQVQEAPDFPDLNVVATQNSKATVPYVSFNAKEDTVNLDPSLSPVC